METNLKEYYTTRIRTQGKTLDEIAAELGVTVQTVKRRIKAMYVRPSYGVKLIEDAKENAKKRAAEAKREETQDECIEEKPLLMPDTCVLLEKLDALRGHRMIIPQFCINEMMRICEDDLDSKRRDFIAWLQDSSDVEIVREDKLPWLDNCGMGYKKRNYIFAKYFMMFSRLHPELELATFSREVKQILTENGVVAVYFTA